VHGPLEHFHFLTVCRTNRQYVASFAVTSREPIPGERLFFLEQRSDGQSRELQLFPGLESPTYEMVAAEIRQLLREAMSEGNS
jgi:hypothetical protein